MNDLDPNLVRRVESVWRNGPPAEREELINGIARYVCKLGDLSVSDVELRAMQKFFGVEDAIELYQRIRDDSARFEGEWREQFITYFRAVRDALPPQQLTEEEYDDWLRANGADI
jgi:hypothetical protein